MTRQEIHFAAKEEPTIARLIDWSQYDTLKAQGLSDRAIARQWGIPWSTFGREKGKRFPVSRSPDTAPVQSSADTGAVQTIQADVEQMRTELHTLTALAAQRGLSPSQLVQELLWKALSDRRSSTP